MKLCVFKETATRTPAKLLIRLFDLITRNEAEPRWAGCVNLVFTTDRRLRKLNRQFRTIDKATDVLSFNLSDPVDPEAVFGEVYISVKRAKMQARDYRTTLTMEYLRLACHGFLHLFGYDHRRAADAKIMRNREDYYLGQLEGTH